VDWRRAAYSNLIADAIDAFIDWQVDLTKKSGVYRLCFSQRRKARKEKPGKEINHGLKVELLI